MTTRKFFQGEKLESFELSPYVYESILAEHYSWSLEEIRDLNLFDFYVHVRICLIKDGVDADFKVKLAGGGPSTGRSLEPVTSKERLPSGATKQIKREKAMSFSSKVRSVQVRPEEINRTVILE